jgi:hypothetical protein
MMEIRFDKTKDEVALLIWFLVDHSVLYKVKNKNCFIAFFECCPNNNCDNKQHNVRSLKFASATSTNLCPFLLYRQVRQAPLNTKC